MRAQSHADAGGGDCSGSISSSRLRRRRSDFGSAKEKRRRSQLCNRERRRRGGRKDSLSTRRSLIPRLRLSSIGTARSVLSFRWGRDRRRRSSNVRGDVAGDGFDTCSLRRERRKREVSLDQNLQPTAFLACSGKRGQERKEVQENQGCSRWCRWWRPWLWRRTGKERRSAKQVVSRRFSFPPSGVRERERPSTYWDTQYQGSCLRSRTVEDREMRRLAFRGGELDPPPFSSLVFSVSPNSALTDVVITPPVMV